MKRRENKRRPSTDLLVCFPSRAAHLTLTHPKSIYSPGRPSDLKPKPPMMINRHRRSKSRGAAPILWAKSVSSMEIVEPTSPKVTCSGQIRSVKSSTNHNSNNNINRKNWQSVMEEIERIHKRKQKKKNWSESFGFKKDIFQFFTCLRNLRFDFQCFGGLPSTELTTTTDDEDDDDVDLDGFDQTGQMGIEHEGSRSEFSKWFTLLQHEQVKEEPISSIPPPNALLLMRCRSAPAKSWLVESEEEEGKTEEKETLDKLKVKYDEKLYKLSSEIVEETWVVGGMRDHLLRSRSWKR